jgi:hypothetical protein
MNKRSNNQKPKRQAIRVDKYKAVIQIEYYLLEMYSLKKYGKSYEEAKSETNKDIRQYHDFNPKVVEDFGLAFATRYFLTNSLLSKEIQKKIVENDNLLV